MIDEYCVVKNGNNEKFRGYFKKLDDTVDYAQKLIEKMKKIYSKRQKGICSDYL